MTKIALFPGSFDPITNGHIEIIKLALNIFDEVVIGIGNNTTKKYCFSLEKRIKAVKVACKNFNGIKKIIPYSGLTIEVCRELGVKTIIRGVRTQADFQFEYDIAVNNYTMDRDIQTILIPSPPWVAHIRSTIVREIYLLGGDISLFVPFEVIDVLKK